MIRRNFTRFQAITDVKSTKILDVDAFSIVSHYTFLTNASNAMLALIDALIDALYTNKKKNR